MTASSALLCCGPSLCSTWNDDSAARYAKVLAINSAVTHPAARHVDWWIFMDPHKAHKIKPAGKVHGIYCAGPSVAQLRNGDLEQFGLPRGLPAIDGSEICRQTMPPEQPLGYSITFAIALCCHLSLGVVDVYGCDMAGNEHNDGTVDLPSTRERWDIDDRPGQRAEVERIAGRKWEKGERIDRWLREKAEIAIAMRWAEQFKKTRFNFVGGSPC